MTVLFGAGKVTGELGGFEYVKYDNCVSAQCVATS